MNRYDSISPFDARYYGADESFFKRVQPFLSEEAQIRYQIRVERALLEAFADLGLIEKEKLEQASSSLDEITPEEVYQEEEITQHNIRALVNCMQRRLDESTAAFVHLTATSYDIADTAKSLCMKEFTEQVLVPMACDLMNRLIGMARKYSGLVQIGRTHGQHAIPTTFGNAVALYVSRLGKRIEKLAECASALTGKFSGAVGSYAAQSLVFPEDPTVLEKNVLGRLGIKAPVTNMASQLVEPEYMTDLGYYAVSMFSVLANLADDFRHLMRSEIRELGKKVQAGHVGSSTMPHKVNPKDFENVKSLWKAYMPRIVTLLSDQISEHQRDLTNSASGRYFPELIGALAYAIRRTISALDQVIVNEEEVARNLDHSVAQFLAEPLYIVLSSSGINNGYDIMKMAARKAREQGVSIAVLVEKNDELKKLTEKLPEKSRKLLKEILDKPMKYVGIAEKACLETIEYWKNRIAELQKNLPA
jgi:adenylosuccinate lyase